MNEDLIAFVMLRRDALRAGCAACTPLGHENGEYKRLIELRDDLKIIIPSPLSLMMNKVGLWLFQILKEQFCDSL